MFIGAALALAGCAGNCPKPVFANPATVSASVGASGAEELVVRWSPSNDDPVPGTYYEYVAIRSDSAQAYPSVSVRLSAPHELAIAVPDLAAFARDHHDVTLTLEFPDTRGFVPCSHPGQGDSHDVRLHLRFDAEGKPLDAVFSEVHTSYGAL